MAESAPQIQYRSELVAEFEEGAQSGQSIDQELAAIDKTRRENRPAYNKNYALQARERELIEARSKIQSRSRA